MSTEIEQIEFNLDEVQDLADKCLNFTEILCAREFYPYQKDTARAIVIDILANLGNTLTGLFSRQSGKSETVANTASALMVILPKLANLHTDDGWVFPQLQKFRRGFWVGIFSPSNTQSSTTYKRLRDRLTSKDGKDILDTPELALPGNETLWPPVSNKGDYLELNNGSFCLMMSADKKSNIESKTFHLILLDEAQDLDEFIVGKSIMPMGAATNATTVATGTPSTTKGFFYNMIEFNKVEELNRKRPDKQFIPRIHFQFDYKTVQKYNPNYRKYVAKEKKKLGYDSDEFKMAYRLIWLLERGMAVTKEQFDNLTKKNLNIVTYERKERLVGGLDWGKESDSTVFTVGKPLWSQIDEEGRAPVEVLNWWERLGDNWEEVTQDFKRQLENYSVETLAVDSTGAGEPLTERLTIELPHIQIIPVTFSPQAKDHLYKFFLLMIQEGKVWWPGDSKVRNRKYFKMFESQMTNLVKEYKGNGKYLNCHAPEDQKNAHDDFPDSLALMLWCINEQAMPFVQTTSDPGIYTGRNWHTKTSGFSLR